jgi:hypothetical protein
MTHFRAFHIWVPLTSAQRVFGTVWWFLKPFVPDAALLSPDNNAILYPSTKERASPSPNGSDLLGRCFFEPQLGICYVTRMGPALSREDDAAVASLHYRCIATQGEYYSPIDQIVKWINDGPLLQPPKPDLSKPTVAPVTYPHGLPMPSGNQPRPSDLCTPPDTHPTMLPRNHDSDETSAATSLDPPIPLRRSQRKRKVPDFLRPKFKGQAYFAASASHLTRKQRVPTLWVYVGKQRVSQPEVKIRRLLNMKDKSQAYQDTFKRY